MADQPRVTRFKINWGDQASQESTVEMSQDGELQQVNNLDNVVQKSTVEMNQDAKLQQENNINVVKESTVGTAISHVYNIHYTYNWIDYCYEI